MYIKFQGKKRQPLVTFFFFFLCKQKGLIALITGCIFQKIALPSDFMHIFHDFIHVHIPWAGAYNPLGPKFLMSIERPHHNGYLLQV